jgi:predicted RNase H-like HicB family nuclease
VSIEREYEIVLHSEPEGGFSVFVPELPSVATQGETIEQPPR